MNVPRNTLLAGLVVLLLVSCTSGREERNESPVPEEGCLSRLLVGTVLEVSDTNFFDRGLVRFMWTLTHYGLVRFDRDGAIVPALARSWETADLKRWVFHLRNEATWHDGAPVTAEDIVFTVDFARRHEPSWQSVYGDVVSVEALDPHTVVFELKGADYNFLTTIAVLTPVPKHVFQSVEDPGRFNEKRALTGTGPYAFESFDRNAGLVKFTAFDGYWGGRPAVFNLVIRLFKNQETMMMAFVKGEIDVPYTYGKGVSVYYVSSLEKKDGIGLLVAQGGGLGNVLWINNSRRPLSDRGFRQALSYAIQYEEVRDLFTMGHGSVPDAGFVLEGSQGYVETRKMVYDAGRAKILLEEAGFIDRDGDGLREAPDGSPLELTLVAVGELSDQVRLSELIQRYLAGVGLRVGIRLLDSGSFGTVMDVDKNFDLALSMTTRWGMSMGPGLGSGYVDSRYYGWSMVGAPEYHAMVDDLKTTMDSSRRRELAARIQDYYAREMTQIPLYTLDIVQPYGKKYEGWVYSAYTGILCPETFHGLRKAGKGH